MQTTPSADNLPEKSLSPKPVRAPRHRRRGKITAVLAVVLAAVLAGCATQQTEAIGTPPQPPAADTPAEAAAALTTADVETWLDGMLPAALNREGIAGAVVSVVHDGQVLTERGYGYADTGADGAAPAPVDAQETLFRVGSISKLAVSTAVMQLVEQGQVDLDEPVADLIDFEIPTRFEEPITLRHLLTHTAGFEERMRGLFPDPNEELPALREVLADPPEQIFAPGTTPAYSNYSYGLAGYVVEQVSGMAFEDYVRTHIFDSLGMDTATFAQPLPESLADQMATGYMHRASDPLAFEYVAPAPAGSMTAAAPDMSAFMLAHLGFDPIGNDGAGQGSQSDGDARADDGDAGAADGDAGADDGEGTSAFLSPELVQTMQQPALGADTLGGLAHGPTMALGWWQLDRNGHRILGHGGDTIAFHSELQIYPESGTGIYVAMNSSGVNPASTSVLREQLLHGFADRYFPADGAGVPGIESGSDAAGRADAQATDTAVEHAQVLAGAYTVSRAVESNFIRLLRVLGQVTIQTDDDGVVTIDALTDTAGQPLRFVETEPWVWQEIGGQQRVAADVVDGQMRAVGIAPALTLEPMPAAFSVAMPALVVGLLVLVVSLIGWPVAGLVRRRYRVRLEMSRGMRRWRLASLLAAGLAVAAVLAWGMVALPLMGMGDASAGLIRVAQVLTLLGALGVIPAAARAVISVRERRWWRLAADVVLLTGFAGFAYVAIVARLLGWDITY
ncbi:MAG TPA: serine hydrolase domain-containing protein [Beutenbergiaceae bacterium]|nr:serine hydrolase domain-containing protein [Beutenbergiaceae bacterium]